MSNQRSELSLAFVLILITGVGIILGIILGYGGAWLLGIPQRTDELERELVSRQGQLLRIDYEAILHDRLNRREADTIADFDRAKRICDKGKQLDQQISLGHDGTQWFSCYEVNDAEMWRNP